MSRGVATVFVEHGHLVFPGHQGNGGGGGSENTGDNGDDESVTCSHIRKRDKFLALFRQASPEHNGISQDVSPKAAVTQASAEVEQAVSDTAVKSLDMKPLPPIPPTKLRLDVFPQNVNKPTVRIHLPEFRARIDTTPQLALCIGLLGNLTQLENNSQDTLTDMTLLNWVKAMEQDPIEKNHIRWLGTRMVEEFAMDPLKDSTEIAEIVLLGPVLDRGHYRRLLSCLIKEFEQSTILDVPLLQGLVQLVQSAPPGFLVADDLIKVLSILRIHLQGTHQQSSEHPYHLNLAVSRLLDVMADHKVQDLDRVVEHEPLSGVLSGLKDSSDPYLMYQACYAFQALQYVPDDETTWQAVLRHSQGAVEGAIKVYGITQLDLSGLLEGLKEIQKTAEETVEAAKAGFEGFRTVFESGCGLIESTQESFRSGHRRSWYPALRVADGLVREGRLADLNRLICEVPCRQDPLFQWGICQLLGDIAVGPIWGVAIRQRAIDLLGELYRNDPEWGRDVRVKNWMAAILSQLETISDDAVKTSAHALLKGLQLDQGAMDQPLYPHALRSRLPRPTSSPLLARVQNIPYVEYDLHHLRRQRLEENLHTVYIPPQAKANLQARDDDLFPLAEKVQGFLESTRQVMLILGDSGAGKSTFNRHLERTLWINYKQGDPIPLYINLPTIDRPDQDLIGKQLRIYNFNDDQINELKLHYRFTIICDGYDESQLLANIHSTNLLNQPRQWDTKMIISCRTQFLGPIYLDRFKPLPSNHHYTIKLDLFQEAVLAPFSKAQIKSYVEQYILDPAAQDAFEDRPVWSAKEYMDKLEAIPNLMDLIKNPFLLTLALKALPSVVEPAQDLSKIKITRVGLYDKFITQWLEINLRRLQDNTMSLTNEERAALVLLIDDGFIFNGVDYLKRLSASIFQKQDGNPVVQYSHLHNKESWKEEFFSWRPEIRLLRESSPLARTGRQFRFIHRSVLEYFYSRYVFEPDPVANEFGPQADLGSTSPRPPITDHPLSQRNLVPEFSIIQFLAERAQQFPTFKEQLLALLEQSKTDPMASQAAANAITILVKAGVLFNGADLRGIRISRADLSDGQFDSAQMQGANLSGVNLARSWIRQVDFSDAQMDGIQFGEFPYLQHDKDVIARCAYSPDGRVLAVSFADGEFTVYDTTNWQEIHRIQGQESKVNGFVFFPADQQVITGDADGVVRRWNYQSGEDLGVIGESTDGSITSIVYSPSGELIATVCAGESVRFWKVEGGESADVLTSHTDIVLAAVCSPDGRHVAVCSLDDTVRVWDTETQTELLNLEHSHSQVVRVEYSPDGQRVVTGHFEGEIQFWDMAIGNPGITLLGHSLGILAMVFSTNGQWLASSCCDFSVRLWDTQTGSAVAVMNGHALDVNCVAISPDCRQLASGDEDGVVRIWELSANGARVDQHSHSKGVQTVAYSPDGQYILSGGSDRTVRQWEALTGVSTTILDDPAAKVLSVAYSPSGDQFATATDDCKIRLRSQWTVGASCTVLDHSDLVDCLAYSPCGRWIACACRNKQVHLWSTLDATPGHVFTGFRYMVSCVAFSPSGQQVAAGSSDDTIRLWDVSSGDSVAVLSRERNYVRSLAYSPDGVHIVSASEGNVLLWDLTALEADPVYVHEDDGIINCVAFSPCGQWIAAGSAHNVVRLFHLQQAEDAQSWSCVSVLQDFFGPVEGIAWKPVVPLEFVVGSEDCSVRVWRVTEGGDGDDGGVSVGLVWTSTPGQLVATGTIATNVEGLSRINEELLVQRRTLPEPFSYKDWLADNADSESSE